MTSLDKFQALDVTARESFISALEMFHELDVAFCEHFFKQAFQALTSALVDAICK